MGERQSGSGWSGNAKFTRPVVIARGGRVSQANGRRYRTAVGSHTSSQATTLAAPSVPASTRMPSISSRAAFGSAAT